MLINRLAWKESLARLDDLLNGSSPYTRPLICKTIITAYKNKENAAKIKPEDKSVVIDKAAKAIARARFRRDNPSMAQDSQAAKRYAEQYVPHLRDDARAVIEDLPDAIKRMLINPDYLDQL